MVELQPTGPRPYRFAALASLITALAIGAVDSFIHFTLSGRTYVLPAYLAMGIMAMAILALVIVVPMVFLGAIPVAKWRGWDVGGAIVALCWGLFAAFVTASLTDMLPPHGVYRVTGFFDLSALPWLSVVIGIASAFGAYHAYTHLHDRPRLRAILAGIHLASPIILGAACVFVWARLNVGLRAASSPPIILAFDAAVLVVVALAVFVVHKRGVWIGAFATLLAVFMLVLPPIFFFLRDRAPATKAEAASEGPRHIILFVVDTLRADALSVYGMRRYDTPNIDALAKDSVWFTNAQSPAPWTRPAMASILSGVSPLVHGTHKQGITLPHQLDTLGDVFSASGYRTAAIGMNPALAAFSGFSQGFQKYYWFPSSKLAASTGGRLLGAISQRDFGGSLATTTDLTNVGIDWLSEHQDDPFFLWFHYYDPHVPYEPADEFLPDHVEPVRQVGRRFTSRSIDDYCRGRLVLDDAGKEWVQTLYESEVKYVDQQLGRFMQHLKELGIYDDALIVFTSDHGEEFWEHDSLDHGHSLYKEVINVPLMVKLPKSTVTGRRDDFVSTTDLYPTLLNLSAKPFDIARLSGRSLKPALEGAPLAPTQLYLTGLLFYDDREALIWNNQKFIHRFVDGQEELYDLNADPLETVSILDQRPDAVVEAKQLIEAYKVEQARIAELYKLGATGNKSQNPNQALIDILESVGYL